MSDVLPIHLRLIAYIVKSMRARSGEEGGWVLTNAVAAAGPESHGRYLQHKEVHP